MSPPTFSNLEFETAISIIIIIILFSSSVFLFFYLCLFREPFFYFSSSSSFFLIIPPTPSTLFVWFPSPSVCQVSSSSLHLFLFTFFILAWPLVTLHRLLLCHIPLFFLLVFLFFSFLYTVHFPPLQTSCHLTSYENSAFIFLISSSEKTSSNYCFLFFALLAPIFFTFFSFTPSLIIMSFLSPSSFPYLLRHLIFILLPG